MPGLWVRTWRTFLVSIFLIIFWSRVRRSTVMRAPVITPLVPTVSLAEATISPK